MGIAFQLLVWSEGCLRDSASFKRGAQTAQRRVPQLLSSLPRKGFKQRKREYVESLRLLALMQWAETFFGSRLLPTEVLKEGQASRPSPYSRSLCF